MKKSIIDTERLDIAASRLRAISHPMRIAIIAMLEENQELNVTQIHTRLNLEQAATSHHLSILKRKGILRSKRHGKENLYSLKNEALNRLVECIQSCSE
jgi:ArsR family transcriptional regulator, virulence genes transcriptional regulator